VIVPDTAKMMVSRSGVRLAFSMAARSVERP
jgi:hypothetical protein